MEITKAIIPAAGLGTRFLPYTKAIPKEMLPLLNKPALHYIIQEGISSEIKKFLIITNRSKQAIADYFDTSPELDMALKEKHKENLLRSVSDIINTAQFTYIRQPEPAGLGHAISLARDMIDKEYFGIFLPDDIIVNKNPALAQLIAIARQEKASVIAVQEVPTNCISSYGIIGIKKQITPNLFQVSHLIEKPQPKDAPSNLAVIGRYVLSYKIFKALDEVEQFTANELQLTDGITHMLNSSSEKLFAYKIQGTRYDIGTPLGWIKAVIGLALQDPDYGPHIQEFLADHNSLNSFLYNKEKIISKHY